MIIFITNQINVQNNYIKNSLINNVQNILTNSLIEHIIVCIK